MQFFSADATIIFLFAHNKFKKPPLKVAQKNSNPLIFPTALSCPNRRIHVPKCGL